MKHSAPLATHAGRALPLPLDTPEQVARARALLHIFHHPKAPVYLHTGDKAVPTGKTVIAASAKDAHAFVHHIIQQVKAQHPELAQSAHRRPAARRAPARKPALARQGVGIRIVPANAHHPGEVLIPHALLRAHPAFVRVLARYYLSASPVRPGARMARVGLRDVQGPGDFGVLVSTLLDHPALHRALQRLLSSAQQTALQRALKGLAGPPPRTLR